ncbi:MAG: zinc dependent phospholipase C family protein [Thermodesulfobacteriota bacterium]|nr:zinc dependent phospholipase C family protein [Thermodesulfobacteriota bacterium]
MPKENTHLFFADKVLKAIEEETLKSIISSHSYYYHLGAIAPDTFYYGTKDSVNTVSEKLHGRDGYPTNKIILEILETSKDNKDLAFTIGYITHCALDITFHPVINSIARDYSDKDLDKTDSATYMHRHIETCIDNRLNPDFLMGKLIKAYLIEELTFAKIVSREFGLSASQIKRTFKRQLFFNRLFRSETAFKIARLLNKSGILKDKTYLGLFYANLKRENIVIKDNLKYKTLSTGKEKVCNINKMLEGAMPTAMQMIKTAYDYYCGEITKQECIKILSGESLSPGDNS